MVQNNTISKDNADQRRKTSANPNLSNPSVALDEWKRQHQTPDQIQARKELDAMTTEQLDAIASELKPKSTYTDDWELRFITKALELAEMFEDGNEVIIKAKLGDQIPRMFEKMRDSVHDKAETMLRDRQIKVRQHVGIEITGNKLDDLDEKIAQMRQQYASLNHAFHLLLTHFRPRVQGSTGMNFGKYTKLGEFAKVKRMQNRNKKLTMDTYMNSRGSFDKYFSEYQADTPHLAQSEDFVEDLMLDLSNQDGIIEMPEHLE